MVKILLLIYTIWFMYELLTAPTIDEEDFI